MKIPMIASCQWSFQILRQRRLLRTLKSKPRSNNYIKNPSLKGAETITEPALWKIMACVLKIIDKLASDNMNLSTVNILQGLIRRFEFKYKKHFQLGSDDKSDENTQSINDDIDYCGVLLTKSHHQK